MEQKLKRVRAVVSDVDGVLTDGSIVVSEAGETKYFNVRDGMAIKLLQGSGMPFAILSGRASQPVLRRAQELGIEVVLTARLDKQVAIEEISVKLNIPVDEMAYIGDDLPDLAPMRLAAISFCPQDAVAEVRAIADVVLPVDGGKGVVRLATEALLKAQGKWAEILTAFEVRYD